MIPLPQSPWTLAIAELLGLRLAARGSGAQPADLLANLLPKRESPPEGWLEHFLASTPIPGYAGPVSRPDTSASPAELLAQGGGGDALPTQTGSVDPALGKLIGTISPTDSPASFPGASCGLPPGLPPHAGGNTVPPLIEDGALSPDLAALVKRLCGAGTPRDPESMPPQPSRTDPHIGSTPPYFPSPATKRPSTAPGPSPGTAGGATTGGFRVQITVEFDARKLVTEMKLLAETVTRRIVDRQTQIYAGQTRGTISRRR